MTGAKNLQFQTYLQSISEKNDYKRWCDIYTPTDAEGKKVLEKQFSSPFDFGLMVETSQPKQEEEKQKQEETERLPVLEGIRKYADKHVLLVGKPGSGKSTALARLLLEKAQAHLEINSSASSGNDTTIPVFVELRYWQTSIFECIQEFLQRHDPNLYIDETTIKNLLRQGEFLLLIDGINELPSEDARRQVAIFHRNFPQAPMIFTTRDLGVGGNLGINKQLEMQPLTENQMREFVQKYLPQQGEQMLQQLGNRLRELGETPLILTMLCDVFIKSGGEIPKSRGELFRQFDRKVNNLKEDKESVPLPEGLRSWKKELLPYLAFEMMQPENHQGNITDFRLSISRSKTEKIL